MIKQYKLILLRHGESKWNALNLFTGWVDVELSEKGIAEAKRGGELIKEKNLIPDSLHTSLLNRAIKTSELALAAAGIKEIPTTRTWRLNERHYGALQGLKKKILLKNMVKNNSCCGEDLLMYHHHQLNRPINMPKIMIQNTQLCHQVKFH